MVPLKVKAGWAIEYFSDYIADDEGHYVPLKITVGYEDSRYHWMFGFYDPGLWLFEKAHYGHDEKGQPRMVASTNNLKINKRSAVKTKTVVVEVPEFKEGREAKYSKAGQQRKSVTLTLTEQGMSFEGKTVTWDTFLSLLADVPEPENTGLRLVVAADGFSPKKLNDVKTRISILSRELGLKYLSCIYDNVSTHEKSCEEHFFTAPLEFSKDIYIRQNVIGEFKQKYYRSEKGWGMDKTEKHKEWATVYVNSINFQKSLFRREVSAKLKIGYISWPEAKYRFTVQLFDDKWKGLAQDSAEFETSGMILSGKTLLGSTELDFSFGRWVDISKATTFEITVVPVPEDEAGLEQSLTQLGVKTDVQVEVEGEAAAPQKIFDGLPNIFIMEPSQRTFSIFNEVVSLSQDWVWNKTGRQHNKKSYDEIFDGTHNRTAGDILVLVFSLDREDRIPTKYEDLLPKPWPEIEANLKQGRTVELLGKARELNVILLAAPKMDQLKKVIAASKFLSNPKSFIKTGGKGCDVRIEDFKINFDPDRIVYNAIASIRNYGKVTSPKFIVNFCRGDPKAVKPMTHGAGPIKPGGVWNERSLVFGLKDGANEILVVLDPANLVEELDESNNRVLLRVIVRDGRVIEESVSYFSTDEHSKAGKATTNLQVGEGKENLFDYQRRAQVLPPGRYSLWFDGKDDYLEVGPSQSLKLESPFTVELWIKPHFAKETPLIGYGVMNKGGYEGGPGRVKTKGFGIRVYRRSKETEFFIEYCTANQDGIYAKTSGKYPTKNGISEWRHFYHVFDTKEYTPGVDYPLTIGKFLIPTEHNFRGQIGEIRIWNGTRTREEIHRYKDSALTGSEPGLAACWTFEESQGQIAQDISRNRNHARLGSTSRQDDADPEWAKVESADEKTDVQVEDEKP